MRFLGGIVVAALVARSALAADYGEQALHLNSVMLSAAGVGFFEYTADVDGPAKLGLDVLLKDVDDVLKSLTVFDDRGGVGAVQLPSLDESHAAFGDVPFGPDALSSPLDLLNSLQGVEVSVRGPRPLTGRLLRAVTVQEVIGGGNGTPQRIVERTRVSLLTADGLQQFVLEDVDSVDVVDAALRDRIAHAVAATRQQSGQDSRHLTIGSNGDGTRTVHIGYIAGAPLWKASYRLVLPAADGDPGQSKARLQGWATLENVSATDWNGIKLSLQYGDPVSFRQAIYRSYFLPRPEVPIEVFGRIVPDMDTRSRPFAASAEAPPPAPAPMTFMPRRVGGPEMAAAAPPAVARPSEATEISEGVEETLFTLPAPVSLAAGHSASVPILDVELPAERVGLAQADRPHPLSAVKLTNTSSASLPAGVLTLYSTGPGAPYAGDARLGGLPAGESRLLSFATDLRSSLEWRHDAETTIASLTAAAGILHIEERDRQTTRVVITAPPAEPRRIIVEIPKGPDQTIGRDHAQPAEQTATAWRFAVALKAGESTTLVVDVDRIRHESSALIDDTATIARVINQQGLGPAARIALQQIQALRGAEAARTSDRAQLLAQREALEHDEARLRENLAVVPAGDALHTRQVRQLDENETRIATLNQSIEAANQAVAAANQAVVDAIARLSI